MAPHVKALEVEATGIVLSSGRKPHLETVLGISPVASDGGGDESYDVFFGWCYGLVV